MAFHNELRDPSLRLESYQRSFIRDLGVRCMQDLFEFEIGELEEEMDNVRDVDGARKSTSNLQLLVIGVK